MYNDNFWNSSCRKHEREYCILFDGIIARVGIQKLKCPLKSDWAYKLWCYVMYTSVQIMMFVMLCEAVTTLNNWTTTTECINLLCSPHGRQELVSCKLMETTPNIINLNTVNDLDNWLKDPNNICIGRKTTKRRNGKVTKISASKWENNFKINSANCRAKVIQLFLKYILKTPSTELYKRTWRESPWVLVRPQTVPRRNFTAWLETAHSISYEGSQLK